MLKRFAVWVSSESAVIAYGLNALVTAWVAFGFRASPDQVAAVTTIGTAVVAAITAFSARPVSVPVITGAVATCATAAAAFGLHLSSAQIGAGVPVLSLVLSLILRQAVTPLVTLRRQQAEAQRAEQAEAYQPEHAATQHTGRLLSDEDLEALAGKLAPPAPGPPAVQHHVKLDEATMAELAARLTAAVRPGRKPSAPKAMGG